MNKEELRKLQMLQLKIAIEVKRICEKNNIKFFLDCGSMLGAVRHKGFIPWDDDLDIGFLREDYERFIEVVTNEMGEDFYLLNWELDSSYPLPCAKLCLKGTIYQEGIHSNAEDCVKQGIFVDLFPYDRISDNMLCRYLNVLSRKITSHLLMYKCGYRVWSGQGVLKKIKFLPIVVMSSIFRKEKLKKIFMYLADFYNDKETKEVGIEEGGINLRGSYKRSDLCEFIQVEFEDELFPIPIGYENILRGLYGNYMEYPPEDKRYNIHAIRYLDFGKYV